MKKWNLILTSYRSERDFLLDSLEEYPGNFKATNYRDVIIGYTDERESLLDEIKENYIPSLSRLLPIGTNFQFTKENFREKAKESIKPYIKEIKDGETFAVRCERRGFKEEFSSQKIEKDIGSYVWKQLEAAGKTPEVDLEDPDKLIVIETLGPQGGVAILPRKIREHYEFIRI